MNNTKTYILQKDLPDVKAGAVFEMSSKSDFYYRTQHSGSCYTPSLVENNPEWFAEKKLKEEEVKKRIEVKSFSQHIGFHYQMYTSGIIPIEKYEAVKKAIEFVLNLETDNPFNLELLNFKVPEGVKDELKKHRMDEVKITSASPYNSVMNTQDWEILSYQENNEAKTLWTMKNIQNDTWRNNFQNPKFLLDTPVLGGSKFCVYSVLRKSDMSTWTVGEDTPDGKIESFEIDKGGICMKVNLVGNKYLWFHTLEKSETKDTTTPLPEKKKYLPEDVMGCYFAMGRIDEKTINDYLDNIKK